jgi:hypothetical protein
MLSIDRLRLLFVVNVSQPVAISIARQYFIDAGGKEGVFSSVLSLLRAEDYISHSDPTFCTAKGLAALQTVALYKSRDTGRLFFLKAMYRSGNLTEDERPQRNAG